MSWWQREAEKDEQKLERAGKATLRAFKRRFGKEVEVVDCANMTVSFRFKGRILKACRYGAGTSGLWGRVWEITNSKGRGSEHWQGSKVYGDIRDGRNELYRICSHVPPDEVET